jgi:AGZA family xanthine/uracil permease-like MFS transporter
MLSLFGFMHSILPTGGIYWPWTLSSRLPYHWAIAYLGLAALLLLLGQTKAMRGSPAFAEP